MTFKLNEVVEELQEKLGKEIDLNEETYFLQTPTALVKLGLEEDDEDEDKRKLVYEVTGGDKAVLVETDNDIFKDLFIEGDN